LPSQIKEFCHETSIHLFISFNLLDHDGLRQLNAAITGRIAAPGELAPALPRPEPAQ
jgi:hypothetical protein